MYNFNNILYSGDLNRLNLMELDSILSEEDRRRLSKIREYWDFYEGYHWQNIPDSDKPQITENYCRKFVDKYVAFELGLGFKVSFPVEEDGDEDTPSPTTEYINEVWKYNKKDLLCTELGQSKCVTGDGWIKIGFESVGTFKDPFEEHPNGRIKIHVLPTSIVFPEYDSHDKDKINKITIAYPITITENSLILKKPNKKKVIYKQVWTDDTIETYIGGVLEKKRINKYGIVPIVQIKNFPLVGKANGISDLEDVIPLNTEMNIKKSDVSEIIDYHSAPVTVVYGAKVSALEKGANKVWGGLPKDSKVENLELNSDLGASVGYIRDIKTAMHEIGGVPEGALGGSQSISNTSGIALQYVNSPLIERTRVKRLLTATGLSLVNKIILLVSIKEGLYEKPKDIANKDFYNNTVTFPDTLPKDTLMELQQIQMELSAGLESKVGAMKRLGKENIKIKLKEIEEEKEKELEYMEKVNKIRFGGNNEGNNNDGGQQINSGALNGLTPNEMKRKELTGQNVGENMQ